MKTKLFISFLALSILVNAQAPNWKWARSGKGPGHDGGTFISADKKGNCYAIGKFQSPSILLGSITLTASTQYNYAMYMVKYDSLGNVVWAKALAGLNNVDGYSIKTDSTGNSYIVGNYQGSGVLVVGSTTLTASNNSAFVAKFDPSGNGLWATNAGSASGLNPYGKVDIGIDIAGNSYITGVASSMFSFGDSLILTKFGPTGTLAWKKYVHGTNWSSYSIATDKNGNSYVSGLIPGGGTVDFHGAIVTNTIAGASMFVAKYDPSGNLIWAKGAGNYPTLYEPSICIDANGNSYVAGHFLGSYAGFGTTILTNNNLSSGGNDIFLVKFDNLGNIVWAKGAGGGSADDAKGIVADSQGNVYITGFFQNSATFGSINVFGAGAGDVFIAKYDANGNALWAKTAGGTKGETGWSVAVGLNDDLYVTGGFNSTRCIFSADTIVNSDTILNPGECFIARMGRSAGSSTPTGIRKENLNSLSVVPNPFLSKAVIQTNSPLQNGTLILYNSAGQEVKKITGLTGERHALSRDNLPPGIYIMYLLQDSELLGTMRLAISQE